MTTEPHLGLHWRVVMDGDHIDPRAWSHMVGSCRACEKGHLIAQTQHNRGPKDVTWFEAKCSNCGHEVAAPQGKILRESSRHSEMPPGFWSYRTRSKGSS